MTWGRNKWFDSWIHQVTEIFEDLFFCHKGHPSKLGHGISIIIPFRKSKKYPRQAENFEWVKRYWRCQLPGAEIIVGKDPKKHKTFSKSVAINCAVRKSHGDILVIVDADGYITPEAVLHCAHEIRRARLEGLKLWFVPYRQFYRLTEKASDKVINSDPCGSFQQTCPPDPGDVQNTQGSGRGHWYGALIQIMPREAFDCFCGWDERFRGWGGEDHSAMRACDTMYWRHKTLPGCVFHLWHPMFGTEGMGTWVEWNKRLWDNQDKTLRNNDNGRLAARYSMAHGNRERMWRLIQEDRKGE